MDNHPAEITNYFKDWARSLVGEIRTIERDTHGDEGDVYKLVAEQGTFFLKTKFDSTSDEEFEKLKWFQGKIPVPKVVGFATKDGAKALLLGALEGKNAALLSKEWPARKLISKIVSVLKELHAMSSVGWPFNQADDAKILVHGDACLPNFIFNGDSFSGYIDMGDAHLGTPEADLAAVIWSLQYNLGPGHGVAFLQEYGYENPTKEAAEKLRLEYENYQKAHGFL